MQMIKLKTSDNEIFEVEVDVARMCNTLRTLLDNLGIDKKNIEIIPVHNVSSTIFCKVLEWATYHKNDPPIPKNDETCEKLPENISLWDANFLKVDNTTLFELLNAANYLDIFGLLDVASQKMANMICGKNSKEICKMFDIKMDFTPQKKTELCCNNDRNKNN